MSEKLVTETAHMAVVQMETTDVAVRLAEPAIQARKDRNYACWSNSKNWRFGHYFSKEDSRLWVPKKGMANSSTFQINFGHPLGRKALFNLILAYTICTVAAVNVIYILIQQFR